MTDNDNKDPHIREAFEKWYGSSPEKCSEYPNQYRNMVIQARWEAWRDCHLQQAAELSQLKEKNAAQADVINTEIGTFAENNRLKTELKQLRAERAGLNEEALDNASTLAFYLFDQQGWDLGELSAEEITKRIIQRYLEITKLTDSAQRVTNKEGE